MKAKQMEYYHTLRSTFIGQRYIYIFKFLCNLLVYQYRHAEVEQTEH